MRKNKKLNKHSIPFILLAIFHIVLFSVFAKRCKEKNIGLLLLTNIGLAYLFEYPVLILLKGYTYKPYILKNRAQDKVLGSVLSQGIYVPIAATILTLYRKNMYWKLGTGLSYYLIEKLFLSLKIYKANWWKPEYTLFFLLIYFHISDRLYNGIKAQKNWVLSIANYLSAAVIVNTLMFVSAILRIYRYGRGSYHSWREHNLISPLYSFFLSFFVAKNSAKPGIQPRLTMVLSSTMLDILLQKIGILKIKLKPLGGNVPFYALMTFLSRYLYVKIFPKQ